MYMKTGALAPRIISPAAHWTVGGTPMPPISLSAESRHHSPSHSVWNDFLMPSSRWAVWVCGSKRTGFRSPDS